MLRSHRPILALGLLLTVSACGQEAPAAPAVPPPAPPPAAQSTPAMPPPPSVTPPPPSAPTSASAPPVAGRTVVLDAGHNGGNAANPAAINKKVTAGRGQTKPCNTTGTSTDDGYQEHKFTFDVTGEVADELRAKGVRVVLTRDGDDGVGPCVDERARIGNEADADAVVSIHADGSKSAGAHGFHIAYSAPPLNTAQGEPSERLAATLRNGMAQGGFPLSDYIGQDGLSPRDDLAGLNLSERPAALVECGNMRNAGEAAAMSTKDGRAKYAAAIADGILAYLG